MTVYTTEHCIRPRKLTGVANMPRLRFYLLALAVLVMQFMASFQVDAQTTVPGAAYDPGPLGTRGTHSISDMWRGIRQGQAGLVTIDSPENAVLINADGTWWSQLRNEDGALITFGWILLSSIVAAVAVYFVLKRRIPIDGGRSNKRVPRFSLAQRVVHWTIACVFLLLAFTGLVILFGRPFLIPLFGQKGFSILASAVMQTHNLFGPVFSVSLIALFFSFVRGNFPALSDLRWLLKGGGLWGGHASAGRYNAGEKVWFWIAVIAGVLLSVSGFMLLFPEFTAVRDLLQNAELVHGLAALGFVGFAIGHIYLGTVGTEGTLEGMTTGDVDENWARAHHDLWFAQIEAERQRGAK